MDERTRQLIDQAKTAMDLACAGEPDDTVGAHFVITYLDKDGQITTRTSLATAEQVALVAIQVAEAIMANVVKGTIDDYMVPASPTILPTREEQN